MRRSAALILTLLVLPSAALAASPLTLRDAMAAARSHAREVTAATARREAATARLRQARGFRLPSFAVTESWVRTNSPAEAFALKLNQERFSFADFTTSDPNAPEALNTAMTRFELSMPLFTGGELSGRIQQAELAASSAAEGETWAGHQTAQQTAEAYIMLAQAEEYVRLLEHARDTVRAHVELAGAYAEEGMLVRSELLRAEVELARVDDLLADARGKARIAAANLAFRMGVGQGATFELAPLAAPLPLEEGLDGWLGSVAERKDLAAARLMLGAGQVEERVQRAAFWPRVGLAARADWFDSSLFGSHGDSTSILGFATMNLFAGGASRAAVAAARFDARAGAEDVKRFEEGVELETRSAFEEARAARSRHATAVKAVAAAAEAERITNERFKTGVVKTIDVLDATNARREAETRELVSRADANAALIRLAVKAGRAPESVLP